MATTDPHRAPVDGDTSLRAALDVLASRVVVLGSQIAESLYEQRDPVGQTVRINEKVFTVIGVLKSKGAGDDNQILVPITTAASRLTSQRTPDGNINVQTINVKADSAGVIDDALAEITTLLRHDSDGKVDRRDRRTSSGQRRNRNATEVQVPPGSTHVADGDVEPVEGPVLRTYLERTASAGLDNDRLCIEVAVGICARRIRHTGACERHLDPQAVKVGNHLGARSNIRAIKQRSDLDGLRNRAVAEGDRAIFAFILERVGPGLSA